MFGRRVYQMVPVDIDETTLQKISDMTGGKYYRADNAYKFQAIYAEIDKLEKSEADVKKLAYHTELFAWLISIGFVLLTAEVAMGQTVLRRLP
jgi:Ca-activated chloride channel family protein